MTYDRLIRLRDLARSRGDLAAELILSARLRAARRRRIVTKPLVFVSVTEGIAETWRTFPGVGEPEVEIIDFDRDESDPEDWRDFASRLRAIARRVKRRDADFAYQLRAEATTFARQAREALS